MSVKSFAVTAMVAAASLSPAMAGAEDLPTRKAGLWESIITVGDGKTQPTTVKQCVDAETDKAALLGATTELCDMTWKRVGDDRIETETKCALGPIQASGKAGAPAGLNATFSASGKGVIIGDFNANIRMETTTTTTAWGDGEAEGAPKQNILTLTQTLLIETKWLGPCEAGQKPGDIITADGKVMRMPAMPTK